MSFGARRLSLSGSGNSLNIRPIATFFQLDRRIAELLGLQLASQIPLVQEPSKPENPTTNTEAVRLGGPIIWERSDNRVSCR